MSLSPHKLNFLSISLPSTLNQTRLLQFSRLPGSNPALNYMPSKFIASLENLAQRRYDSGQVENFINPITEFLSSSLVSSLHKGNEYIITYSGVKGAGVAVEEEEEEEETMEEEGN